MKNKSLKYSTLRYLVIAILGIIAIWAASFYLLIIEEVYDNIDDGLKDSRIRILHEIESDSEILQTVDYGIAQFKITPLPIGNYSKKIHIYNSKMYMAYDNDDEPVRILQTIFKNQNQNYQLEIYTSTVEEDEFIENLLIALSALYIALVGSIILINHFILKKAWSPFYIILNNLKSYKIGTKKGFEKTNSEIIEFDELEAELSAMIDRNEKIYEQQKQFIANASHELQTPLAIAGNKLELLIEEKDITENQAHKIGEINEMLNRLKRLNKSLLTLSKIENNQFQHKENLNFNELIKQSLFELEMMTEFKKINVTIKENGIFQFEMNADLAGILINNLLKNAIVHNEQNGFLNVFISPEKISIQNPGENPLNSQFIFERFYKDEQNENSTGLGLAIVKSIVKIYPELSINYRFDSRHYFELEKK
ncbi:sensor histidine kinase [Moheibacter sediminis]|uniref:histidine kinase n=1 Tax=Moheibacter sediminis TaxID=1434700 RepID=A0A1W2BTC0_9FLAO|nr:HAMP domain-containing sensor histidine kinase [Moheibacter sediminis]SMC76139.1 Signal transduction histidine kinase [Moheibacter sediminis]